jgi:hypothetical protein
LAKRQSTATLLGDAVEGVDLASPSLVVDAERSSAGNSVATIDRAS